MRTNRKQNRIEVLDRAFTIISFLEGTESGIGLTEISKQTGINKATCYRILQSLMSGNFIEYGDQNGTYRLGLRFIELGKNVQRRLDIRGVALPHLEELRDKTGDTVYLCVLNNNESLCIERVEGTYVQILLLHVGDRWPLYVGAAPRAMLAFLDDHTINNIISSPEDKIPIHPKIVHSDYWELIESIRDKGYSVSYEDVLQGVSSIGAPVFNHTGKIVASVSISSTTEKINPDIEGDIAALVVETANTISHSLGWDRRNSR